MGLVFGDQDPLGFVHGVRSSRGSTARTAGVAGMRVTPSEPRPVPCRRLAITVAGVIGREVASGAEVARRGLRAAGVAVPGIGKPGLLERGDRVELGSGRRARGRASRRRRRAIIAALSAQSRGRRDPKRDPRARRTPRRAPARSARLHATPPPRLSARAPVGVERARASCRRGTSTTAAWNDAATSATSRAAYGGSPCASSALATAVLRPENEKSKPGLVEHRPREVERRRVARRPRSASIAGPPGKPRPSTLRDLVERLAGRVVARAAEPAVAAESVHLDELGVPARDDQRRRAGHGLSPCSSVAAWRCASMWLTPDDRDPERAARTPSRTRRPRPASRRAPARASRRSR